MNRLDKHRIFYEGMVDFFYEDRLLIFRKSLKRIFHGGYPIYIERSGKTSLIFHCIANVNRKSHVVDNALKSLIKKHKDDYDISVIRIDKRYLSNPVLLYAYLKQR